MKSRLRIFFLLMIILIVFSANTERAYATTETYHLEDQTVTLSAWNTCFGSFQGTLTYDGVIHVTENKNSYHIITVMHGMAEVYLPGSENPDYVGNFSEIRVEQTTSNKDFLVQAITDLGDNFLFHITFKISYTDGEIEVFNTACGN